MTKVNNVKVTKKVDELMTKHEGDVWACIDEVWDILDETFRNQDCELASTFPTEFDKRFEIYDRYDEERSYWKEVKGALFQLA